MGRVVAHELGHVLLETTAHSATGLMRAIFDANDAMSPDERTTDLSTTESQQLAIRFSLVPLDASPEPTVLAQGGR
jgi:Zn-dependent peptidase ImmA (M78 family)